MCDVTVMLSFQHPSPKHLEHANAALEAGARRELVIPDPYTGARCQANVEARASRGGAGPARGEIPETAVKLHLGMRLSPGCGRPLLRAPSCGRAEPRAGERRAEGRSLPQSGGLGDLRGARLPVASSARYGE